MAIFNSYVKLPEGKVYDSLPVQWNAAQEKYLKEASLELAKARNGDATSLFVAT